MGIIGSIIENGPMGASLPLTAKSGTPAQQNGCGPLALLVTPNGQNIEYFSFGTVKTEFGHWDIIVPQNFTEQPFCVRFHWGTGTGGAPGQFVRWRIEGVSYSDGEALDQPWPVSEFIDDEWTGNNIAQVSEPLDIDVIPPRGSLVQLRISRPPAEDTLTANAFFFAACVNFPTL